VEGKGKEVCTPKTRKRKTRNENKVTATKEREAKLRFEHLNVVSDMFFYVAWGGGGGYGVCVF
jgi:hypothetical protein